MTLIEALTQQFQFWLGEAASIGPQDVATMMKAAQAEILKDVKSVKIIIEGEPDDVALVSTTLKQVLQVSEKRLANFEAGDGRIRRELEMEGKVEERPQARPGNLDPEAIAPQQTAPPKPKPLSGDDRIYNALITLARGLLAFPTDDEGRRRFQSAYPPGFKEGVSKLSAYFLTKGVIISDPLEYWRLLSKPLKDWPHMPAGLQSPDPLIDQEGRTTSLTEHLAQRTERR